MATPYKGEYGSHAYNRLQNLDGIEWKIISHLIMSDTVHAENFWKILNYGETTALSQNSLTLEQKKELICVDNWETTSTNTGTKSDNGLTDKKLFMQPFVDDAWSEQCSSVYVYVDKVSPKDASRADITIVVEVIVNAKLSVLKIDKDNCNPNDFDKQGNIVVPFKNRATVLLKSIVAELNGLYLDGIGNLQLDPSMKETGAKMSLWNSRSFYGYAIKFGTVLSGVSDDPSDSC